MKSLIPQWFSYSHLNQIDVPYTFHTDCPNVCGCYILHMVIAFHSTSAASTSAKDTHSVYDEAVLTSTLNLAQRPLSSTETYWHFSQLFGCWQPCLSWTDTSNFTTQAHRSQDSLVDHVQRCSTLTPLLSCSRHGHIRHGSCSCDNSRGLTLNGLCWVGAVTPNNMAELWPSLTSHHYHKWLNTKSKVKVAVAVFQGLTRSTCQEEGKTSSSPWWHNESTLLQLEAYFL